MVLLLLQYNRKHPTVITALAYVVHSAISQSSLPSTPEATSQEQSMGIQGNASQAGLQADETGLHDNTAVATCGYAVVSQQPSSSSPATYRYGAFQMTAQPNSLSQPAEGQGAGGAWLQSLAPPCSMLNTLQCV
jgi:hypothetical protein